MIIPQSTLEPFGYTGIPSVQITHTTIEAAVTHCYDRLKDYIREYGVLNTDELQATMTAIVLKLNKYFSEKNAVTCEITRNPMFANAWKFHINITYPEGKNTVNFDGVFYVKEV